MMCEAENAKRLAIVYMAWPSDRVLCQIRTSRFAPIVRILVRRGIVDTGKVEGFAPLDACAATAAMVHAALVTRPCFGKRHTEPCSLSYDAGFALAQERRHKSNLCQA